MFVLEFTWLSVLSCFHFNIENSFFSLGEEEAEDRLLGNKTAEQNDKHAEFHDEAEVDKKTDSLRTDDI